MRLHLARVVPLDNDVPVPGESTFMNPLQTISPNVSKMPIHIPIGDPMEDGTLVGPLIDEDAVQMFENAVAEIRAQGGEILVGGDEWIAPVTLLNPLVRVTNPLPMAKEETFAPILYVHTYSDLMTQLLPKTT